MEADRELASVVDEEARVRMLAVRNAVGGRFLCNPRADLRELTTPYWRVMVRLRLGLSVLPDTGCPPRCAMEYADGTGKCLKPTDAWGNHAVSCAVGPWRGRRHSALAKLLWKWLSDAGWIADREVMVPKWRKVEGDGRVVQAVMDIVASGHSHMPSMMIDASIRSPHAAQYRPRAARVPGHALEVCESQKHVRYPDREGLHVRVAAVECFGRLGSEFSSILEVAAAAHSEERRSRGLPSRSVKDRWLTQLSVCVAWHVSNAVLLSHKSSSEEQPLPD